MTRANLSSKKLRLSGFFQQPGYGYSRKIPKILYKIISVFLILGLFFPYFVLIADIARAFTLESETEKFTIRGKENNLNPSLSLPEISDFGLAFKHPQSLTNFQVAQEKAKVSFPVMFVENIGQFDPEVLFQYRGAHGFINFTATGILISTTEPLPLEEYSSREKNQGLVLARKRATVFIEFGGGNSNTNVTPHGEIDTTVSYFKGNQPNKWVTDAPAWSSLTYENLYPGIDLEISSQAGEFKWELRADAKTNFSPVQLKTFGEISSVLLDNGISISTELGTFYLPYLTITDTMGNRIDAPQNLIPSKEENAITAPFSGSLEAAGTLLDQKTLSISPLSEITDDTQLLFSTYLGGPTPDHAEGIFVTEAGDVYLTGITDSDNSLAHPFPENLDAFDGDLPNDDAFVVKVSGDGSTVDLITYLGGETAEGDSFDWGQDINVDSDGSIYVTGITWSEDFPETTNLTTREPHSDGKVFVTKINSTGTSLIYSVLLESDGDASPSALTVDGDGNVYITGASDLAGYPTVNPIFNCDEEYGSGFISKINSNGTALVYSTCLSDANSTNSTYHASDIEVDANGAAYVIGSLVDTNESEDHIFIYKINSTGSGLDYSTLLGGTDFEILPGVYTPIDWGIGLKLNSLNEVVFSGYTYAIDFVSEDTRAWQSVLGGGSDVIIGKLSTTGDVIFTTYLGGPQYDSGGRPAIAVDNNDNIYIAGETGGGFPVTTTGYDISANGDGDAFLSIFSPDGQNLLYSSYFGGSDRDIPTGIGLDGNNVVFMTGWTRSSDFYLPGSYDTTFGGQADIFLLSVDPPLGSVIDDRAVYSSCKNKFGGGLANGDSDCALSGDLTKNQGNVADPINTRTGALDYSLVDISFPTIGGTLAFTRYYNSLVVNRYTDLLGYGWTHNHDIRLIFPSDPEGEDGKVLLKGHSANQFSFSNLGDGVYRSDPGVLASLVKDDGLPVTYTLTDSGKNSYTFDDAGKLQTRTDTSGNIINYSYNLDGTLDQVADGSGTRYLEFAYTSTTPARIGSISDHTNRQISFTYDASGNLETFTDVMGQTWTYTYNPNHQLETILDQNLDLVLQTDYDNEGRAYRQFNGAGDLLAMINYFYQDEGYSTVYDVYGHDTVHNYDFRNTLAGETDPLDQSISKTYDYNFRPASIEDQRGNMTSLDWSSDGANLELVVDAQNNETNLQYDSLNNLVSVTDANNHLTQYYYEDTNFPTKPTKIEYPISFDGGVTWVTTLYQYYQPGNPEGQPAGEVRLVIDPKGYQTYYEYNADGHVTLITSAYGTAEAQSTTYAYDDLGRRVETVSPTGLINRTEYDAAGRVTRMIQNCKENYPTDCMATFGRNYQDASGVYFNLVTAYTYDLRGNQIAVGDTLGKITRTYYDGADRPVTVVQNLTGQAISVETPPTRGTGNIDENLRSDTYYDYNSNVIATEDQDGTISRTYYDAANRPVYTVQNLVGQDLVVTTPPTHDPATPDQNIVTEYVYDPVGNTIAVIDVDGVISRTYYDALNRPYAVVRNLTAQAISVETPPDRTASSSDANLRSDTYYDPNGNVIVTVDPAGKISRTYYDALNRPETVVQNFAGNVQNALDSTTPPDRSTSTSESNLRTDTYYDENGRVVATENPAGRVTVNEYNELGQLVKVTVNAWDGQPQNYLDQYNIVTGYTYDDAGRLVTTTDTNGKLTENEYDFQGRLARVTENKLDGQAQNYLDEFNLITTYTYDEVGRTVTTTDTMRRVTRNTYDDLGRIVSVTQNENGSVQNDQNQYNLITSYTYDLSGSQIAITDTLGSVTRTYYDGLNRPVTVVQNLSQAIGLETPPARGIGDTDIRMDTIYKGNGTVLKTIDPLGLETIYGYDGLNRQTAFLDPAGITTQLGYDINGYRISQTDGEGIVTAFEYDALGRLTAVVENYISGGPVDTQTNVRTEYTYDISGNRLTIRDGNATLNGTSDVTAFTYDALNRLDTETDPIGNVWDHGFEYDPLGNRETLLDANGVLTTYQYDTLGQLRGIDYPGTDQDVLFTYNALGHRIQMTDGIGTTSWTPDSLGRPVSIEDPFNNVVSYEYSPLGNRTQMTYPDARVAGYQYDALSRLAQVIDWDLNLTEYEYDAASRLVEAALPNGITSTYSYDDGNRLESISHDLGVETLSSFDYTYNASGNRTDAAEIIVRPDETVVEDLIFADAFESGDFSNWTTAITGAGDLTVTSAAAGETTAGTHYGMQAVINDATNMFVRSLSPQDETHYQARFYIDTNSLAMGQGNTFVIMDGRDTVQGTTHLLVKLRMTAGQYVIFGQIKNDAGSYTSSGTYPISNGWHAIEIGWQAATAVGADDGYLSLWIDDALQETVGGIDNDTFTLGRVQLGIVSGLDSGTSGVLYFDLFESRSQNYIGLDPDGPNVLPKPDNIFADAFESGDFSNWTSAISDPQLTAAVAAAGEQSAGTHYGMQVEIVDQTELYVVDGSPEDDPEYRARFYLSPNSIAMGEGDSLVVMEAFDTGSSETTVKLTLGYSSGEYTLTASAGVDGGTFADGSSHTLFDGWHAVEIAWSAATMPAANNGVLALSLDDSLVETLAAIDNDTQSVGEVRLGAVSGIDTTTSGTLFFDLFDSHRDTAIGLDADGPDLTPPPAVDEVFADSFESGDLTGWSSAVTDGGDLSVVSDGAGGYMLEALIDDQTNIYVEDDTPASETRYRVRFYLDPSTVTMSNGDSLYVLWAEDESNGDMFGVRLSQNYDEYRISLMVENDSAAQTYTTEYYIPAGWNAIEVDWQAASGPGADDGSAALYMNDALIETIADLDNDTHVVGKVRMGALESIPASVSGSLYLDAFESRDLTYIGRDANAPELPGLLQEIRISQGANDAEEDQSGSVDLTRTWLALGEDWTGPMVVGLRFEDLQIPAGATIKSASVQFTSGDTDSDTASYVIKGDDSDDAGAFTTTSYDLSGRTTTAASVNWSPPAWSSSDAAGPNQMTADLSAILQEIVDRPGWAQGNAVALLFTGTGARTAGSYEGYAEEAANLHVEWYQNGAVVSGSTQLIFADGFESTPDHFAPWPDVDTGGGDMTATTAAAALDDYGAQFLVDDTDRMSVRTFILDEVQEYTARFYLAPNALTLGSWQSHYAYYALDEYDWVHYLEFGYDGYDYFMMVEALEDNSQYTQSQEITLNDDWNAIELNWRGASAAGADDGELKIYLNDVLVETLSGLDDDTITVDQLGFGALASIDSSTSGTYYMDGMEWRSAGHIGLDPDGPGMGLMMSMSVPSAPTEVTGLVSADKLSDSLATTADRFRSRFYLDPNTISMPEGASLLVYALGDDFGEAVVRLYLHYEKDAYWLLAEAFDDNGSWQESDYLSLADSWNAVEIDWMAAKDGYLKLWVNDHLAGEIAGVDNDTLTAVQANLGVSGSETKGVSGRMLFDWHVIGGEEYIGLIKGPVVPADTGISVLENTARKVSPTSIPTATQTPGPTETATLAATATAAAVGTPTPEPTVVVTDTPPPSVSPTPTPTPLPTEEAYNPGNELGYGFDKDLMILSVSYKLAGLTMPGLPSAQLETTVTESLNWHYDYDPLYRLTYACSDWDAVGGVCNGDEFNYAYDAVGNRLSQTINAVTNTYTYDAANRLTSVDGVTYTWDNNGNLLSDGTNTYTYDYANRLVSLTNGVDNYTYQYNGLGDRVQQTVNGVTTTYVLDLNAGLTQVLSDGADTYLYGLSRIGEEDTVWDYYLGDALGSVRQLTDGGGAVSLAQTYQPYGEVASTFGGEETNLGFTGEWQDVSGLIYLRARYVDPYLNQFIQPDPIVPNYVNPQSINKYSYALNNPIRYTDPSGKICLDLWAPSGFHLDPNRGCDYPEGSTGNFWWRRDPLGPDTAIIDMPWVDEQSQEMWNQYPNSCGAAALYMFLRGEDINVDFDILVGQLRAERPGGYDGYCCNDDGWGGRFPTPTPDPLNWCNEACASAETLATVARGYGLNIISGDNWTHMEAYEKVNDGHPVLTLIRSEVSSTSNYFGHFVVIRGFIDGGWTVVFNDSYPGEAYWNVSSDVRKQIGVAREADWDKFDASWASGVDPMDPLAPGGHIRWAMAVD